MTPTDVCVICILAILSYSQSSDLLYFALYALLINILCLNLNLATRLVLLPSKGTGAMYVLLVRLALAFFFLE